MIEPPAIPSAFDLSPRDRRRIVRGVKYGLVGAVLFVVSILLVFVAFELASPFIADAADALFGSEAYQDARWYVTHSRIYEKLVGMF